MPGLFGRRAIAASAIAFAAAFLAPTTSGAITPVGGGANNIVLAQSTGEEPTTERSSVQVTTFAGPNLNSTNVATAIATDCNGCRSVAVAFQAVLAASPTIASPGNAAVASTANCMNCTSFADAFQVVLTPTAGPQPPYLTASGRAAIEGIRAGVSNTVRSGSDVPTLCSALESYKTAFLDALTSPGNIASTGKPLTVTVIDRLPGTCQIPGL